MGQGPRDKRTMAKGTEATAKVSCDRWQMGKALVRLLEMYR